MRRHRSGAYVWAQILYCLAAVLHAGIVNQPTAYEGNNYLLPTVAAVVLGGTSLLGGRGNLVATAVAALFLSQLDQFVLALGVSYATRTLVQAAALAVGVPFTPSTGAGSRDGCSAVARQASHPHNHVVFAQDVRQSDKEKGGRDTMRTKRGGALLVLALACTRCHGRRGDPVGEAVGHAVMVRPQEDQARFHRWVRREQLAPRDDGVGS